MSTVTMETPTIYMLNLGLLGRKNLNLRLQCAKFNFLHLTLTPGFREIVQITLITIHHIYVRTRIVSH